MKRERTVNESGDVVDLLKWNGKNFTEKYIIP